MTAAALVVFALLQQAAGPAATASVDRQDVAVGEMVTLTIRVESMGNLPVEIGEPMLIGLDRRGQREQSQVSVQGGLVTRVTTRQVQLLAERPGAATIGRITVRQGEARAETEPLTVAVESTAGLTAAGLSPRARALLAAMPPPPGAENVGIGVIAAPSVVTIGEQVDLVVAAWFPRDIRLQLRTPPTITGPELRGAWVYPQPVVAGIAASRQEEGRWYDLFVVHQVVFPLASGRLQIGRARASYALPISYSFLTRELPHEVQSEPLSLSVSDQPAAGRPGGFSGMAAAGLSMRISASPRSLSVGDASTVTLTLSGRGNVALWPTPEIRWPDDVRVYPEDVTQAVRLDNGQLVGSKEFTFLVVPDSAGLHSIRGARAAYFDLGARRYAAVETSPLEIVAGEGVRTAPDRPAPPPLMVAEPPGVITGRLTPAGIVLVVLLPPLLALLVRLSPRLVFGRRPPPEGPDTLQNMHRRFRETLERLVPAAALREGDQLDDALRAAGVEEALASHAARLRDRLRHAVYGRGGPGDVDELGAEVNELVRALTGEREPVA